MEDRVHSALIAIRRIMRATEQHEKALARATGLTIPQWVVLRIVGELGETTPKVIASKAHIGQATVTALLDRLQGRGLVTRSRGHTDRRQVWVSLTEDGGSVMRSAPDALQDLFAEKFSALPRWEQAMLVAALERVSSLLDGDEIDAAPMLHSTSIER